MRLASAVPVASMIAVDSPLDLQLASTSPRRRDLLNAAGLRFALCAPGPEYQDGGDEQRLPREGAGDRGHGGSWG